MTRRGEAWCGEVRCGGVWQGVKGVEGRIVRPRPGRSRGLALLKGVDLPGGSGRKAVGGSEALRTPQDASKTAWERVSCEKINEKHVQVQVFPKD